MQRSWKEILDEIQRLQLIAPADFGELKQTISPSGSAERALLQLVNQKKLTKFQALQLLEGRGSRLLIGNYVILKPLGQGGMGTVFKARHPQMNRIVAIKTMLPHLAMQGVASKRFSNEIRFLAQLSHPNIVQAFDADVHDGMPFLVTEFIEGIDLRKLVEKSGPLAMPTALKYMQQAASALAYAHSNNIVHRDVKPANLIVKSDGQIKLLDLGIARASDPSDNEATDIGLTADNSIIGSLEYTSPELFISPKSVGPRSDIYSLGCTFYYIVRGEVPYPGKTPMDFVRSHPKAPIPKLCDRSLALSSQLNSLFQRLVAKTPEKRIQDMSEVAAEFKRLSEMLELAGEPTPANTPPGVGRSKMLDFSFFDSSSNSSLNLSSGDGSWYRSRSAILIGGLVIVLGIVGNIAWQSGWGQKESRQRNPSMMTDDQTNANPNADSHAHAQPTSKVPRMQGSRVFRVDGN